MGILDSPSPLFTAVDDWLGQVLPPAVNVALWGAVGAIACMELYRLLSAQSRIARLKQAFNDARLRVIEFDGEFEDAWPLIRSMLALAVRRIMLVFPATVLASLPLLLVIVWLDTHYGGAYPPNGERIAIDVPGDYSASWVDSGSAPPLARILDEAGGEVAEVTLAAPISEVHKWQWWNVLVGNPAGYLPDSLPFDRVEFHLPRQEILGFGPNWLRGWELVFFTSLIAFALVFKQLRRIE